MGTRAEESCHCVCTCTYTCTRSHTPTLGTDTSRSSMLFKKNSVSICLGGFNGVESIFHYPTHRTQYASFFTLCPLIMSFEVGKQQLKVGTAELP